MSKKQDNSDRNGVPKSRFQKAMAELKEFKWDKRSVHPLRDELESSELWELMSDEQRRLALSAVLAKQQEHDQQRQILTKKGKQT